MILANTWRVYVCRHRWYLHTASRNENRNQARETGQIYHEIDVEYQFKTCIDFERVAASSESYVESRF